ncbi:AbrB/MazE/SpoVT family DNA-binding domain-containing protein [Bacillus cytotoxicus]|uniref:Transition state regulatory protein, abrB n=2 Tax=Bacillus cytotoxicus TaxID=580165 RepID=A0AAX2CH39_9BACI|nr:MULTISPECIES: AbrB/MazE/SpoVT family DNA-binding domain-containing protein [Bacillus cereus group]ABS22131.1 transcriptional regulator, AbrB family [Bacillus cytotoxicus NVH 391-98]AWC28736.1 AbrB/MazE/SpoVT family DNA-binding domain-containing protein [Bacillus cytotoxicus]AWC32748.1 AbrB/MazE/SpoVT family DNA-binding domain-containing protein [Bacillus cytotoxicus]AWC36776.1 AbrB/MazE/SpoVT family DNA-binding domain-containing protein [Bacillus cytotoxicus]AWC39881.1 AbrB/MazE/SpoVT famil
MKSTGIIRKVDELGRIVIPKELRDMLDIGIKSPLEIFVENERIVLKKYVPYNTCQITGEVSNDNISLANGKIILSPEGAKYLIQELENYLVK